MTHERALPLAQVTFVFGSLSIPLAFIRHLCSLAVVVGVLAIAFNLWAQWRLKRGSGYSAQSLRWSFRGMRLAAVGTGSGILMWVLWATNAIL